MAALLNIDKEAARDLEDNFAAVLDRALGGSGRARDIARQLVEHLDLYGYSIDREDLNRADCHKMRHVDREHANWSCLSADDRMGEPLPMTFANNAWPM